MVEELILPVYAVVGMFSGIGVLLFISTWNHYGRKEAVKKLAKTLKTDTAVIADKLAIESESLAEKVKGEMKEFVLTEVKTTYKDIAHDISLLTLAVKDVAKGSIIDAAKKDVIIMKLETEMHLLNEKNWNLKEDAKEDAINIETLKEDAKTDAIKIDDLKEEAAADTANIERLENEK